MNSQENIFFAQRLLNSPTGESTCQCVASYESSCPLSRDGVDSSIEVHVVTELSKFFRNPTGFRDLLRSTEGLVGGDFPGCVLYAHELRSPYSNDYSGLSTSSYGMMSLFFPGTESRERALRFRKWLIEKEGYSSDSEESEEFEEVSYSIWYEAV